MSFADQIGVNVHTSYTRYANLTAVINALTWLGVKWVRDDNPHCLLSAHGFQTLHVTTFVSTTGNINTALQANCAMVELTNEPNNNGLTAAQAKSNNQSFVNFIAGAVPIVNSALGAADLTYASGMGAQSGISYGAVHPYRAMRTPSQWTSYKNSYYATLPIMSPNADFFVTETGWHDYFNPANPPGHTPTRDYIQAEQLIPDQLQILADIPANTTGRAQKIFLYELASQGNTDWSDTNFEHYFGLFYPDWKPKAQAFQLRELLHS